MNDNMTAFVIFAASIGVAGCGTDDASPEKTGKSRSVSPAELWNTRTLHIDGFKKSKSGAI